MCAVCSGEKTNICKPTPPVACVFFLGFNIYLPLAQIEKSCHLYGFCPSTIVRAVYYHSREGVPSKMTKTIMLKASTLRRARAIADTC